MVALLVVLLMVFLMLLMVVLLVVFLMVFLMVFLTVLLVIVTGGVTGLAVLLLAARIPFLFGDMIPPRLTCVVNLASNFLSRDAAVKVTPRPGRLGGRLMASYRCPLTDATAYPV